MDNHLLLYTDGSSAPNPRRGGASFRMIFPNGEHKDFTSLSYIGATNNEMELQACVLGLKEVIKLDDLKGSQGVVVLTDSQYIVSNYRMAMFSWPKQKWIRSNGEPVLNVEQWKEIIRLMKRIGEKFKVSVTFEKVKAHSGVVDNEAVDKMAKKSRKGPVAPLPISVSTVRRKKTKEKTIRGSIKGEGQKIRLRVVSVNWLSTQKIYRARCEVVSRKSPYFKNIDFVLSKFSLRVGHKYEVVLKSGLDHCSIEKIIREIKKK